jgi:hypothetical protein
VYFSLANPIVFEGNSSSYRYSSSAGSITQSGTSSRQLQLALPSDPVFITLTTQRAYLLGLQETHVFSPTFLNVATLGFARAWGTQVQAPGCIGRSSGASFSKERCGLVW